MAVRLRGPARTGRRRCQVGAAPRYPGSREPTRRSTRAWGGSRRSRLLGTHRRGAPARAPPCRRADTLPQGRMHARPRSMEAARVILVQGGQQRHTVEQDRRRLVRLEFRSILAPVLAQRVHHPPALARLAVGHLDQREAEHHMELGKVAARGVVGRGSKAMSCRSSRPARRGDQRRFAVGGRARRSCGSAGCPAGRRGRMGAALDQNRDDVAGHRVMGASWRAWIAARQPG